MLFKDDVLNMLAQRGNIAQFVSFDPYLNLRHAWIRGRAPNAKFLNGWDAVNTLIKNSPEKSVNVRSFDPTSPKSRPFHYGIKDASEVMRLVDSLGRQGLHTIVNETVDINDGGVSGVAFGDIVEFTPGDTPRGVEKPGTLRLPRRLAMRLLEAVYGFKPDLPVQTNTRVEFSVHPIRRGYKNGHTIVWEMEDFAEAPKWTGRVNWPNNFSKLVGDKTFGLLMAHLNGFYVPYTTVIARGIAPFSFGTRTFTGEYWLRTAPATQTPGKFTTQRGWTDPFALMEREDGRRLDPTSMRFNEPVLAAVLSQESVQAQFSGAAIINEQGYVFVEGVQGYGDGFMLGSDAPIELPAHVVEAVESTGTKLGNTFGPGRFEWVFTVGRDTTANGAVYVVQLHVGAVGTEGNVVVPGEAEYWRCFDVGQGLEALRDVLTTIGTREPGHTGIKLVGQVGVTSHFGDVLRKAAIPSRVVPVCNN